MFCTNTYRVWNFYNTSPFKLFGYIPLVFTHASNTFSMDTTSTLLSHFKINLFSTLKPWILLRIRINVNKQGNITLIQSN